MTRQSFPSPDDPYRYAPEPEPLPPQERRSTGRIAALLLLAGVLLLGSWAAIKGIRTYQAMQGLMSLQTEAESLLANGPMDADPTAVVELATSARADIERLNRELAFVQPLAPLLGRLPQVGPLALAAPALLEMADAGSEAATLTLNGLSPALAVIQREDFSADQLGTLLPIIQNAAPQIADASQALERYSAARSELEQQVDPEALPWRVRQLLALADEWVPVAQTALQIAPQLPLLLGMNGPQRYLIMAQNEDELRATGGFLTGAGVLTIENGRILDITLRDANVVDNFIDKPYDFPPQPYYDFMRSEMLLFRDANFWPDFPTSAQKAMDLYAYGQDVSGLAGAIAIDQEFLRLLVDATGPVALEGGGEISADNLLSTLHQARDPKEGEQIGDWVTDRKAFLGGFAAAIRAKLEGDFSDLDPVRLARNMRTALDEHHLQVFVYDTPTEQALVNAGWAGELPTSVEGDFWTVVDTNMGFNKVNYFIDRSFDYVVDLTQPDQVVSRLTTTYTHSGEPSAEPCYQGVEQEFEAGAAYLALANKCYWNYVRVYVPAGSSLIDSSRHVVPAETLFSGVAWDSQAQPVQEAEGLTTFANFMLVSQGQTADFFVNYQLPPATIQPQPDSTWLYSLKVQKQAGTRPERLAITITLPEGATLVEALPTPTTSNGRHVTFETKLRTDSTFQVRYRLP